MQILDVCGLFGGPFFFILSYHLSLDGDRIRVTTSNVDISVTACNPAELLKFSVAFMQDCLCITKVWASTTRQWSLLAAREATAGFRADRLLRVAIITFSLGREARRKTAHYCV